MRKPRRPSAVVLVLLAFFCSVRSQADAQHLRQATDTIGHRDAARKLHIRTGGLLDGQNDAEDLARAAGVFHEENGGAVLHNPDQQDTRAGADNREAIEKALAAGVLAAGWHQERERAPDEIARDAIDAQAQQGVPEGLAKQADTATLLAAGVDAGVHRDLPSFEGTPMPPKRTFREWQDAWLERGGTSPIELTSASFLDPDSPRPGSGYVAACLAARDAHDDISEWVRHHLKLGVYPIYVYDHASVPPMSDVLQPYIAQGDVVYRHFDQYEHPSGKPQLFAFDACLKEHGAAHSWLTFIDVDEFLMFRDGPPVQSLPSLLKRYEGSSALAVHWILFGSSGHEIRPLQGTLRSYTRCLPLNHTQHLFVKTIANTRCTVGTTDSPHAFLHNCSSPVVRVDKSTISGPTASDLPVHSTLVIHHYATKSQEEFEIKMLRGSGMRRQRGWEYFYFVDGWSSEFNFDGLRAWDDDLTTMSRMLDPEVVREQLARYAGEVHEDFWGAQSAQQQRERAQLEQDQWGAEHASQGIAGQDEEDEDAHVVASMNDYGDRVDDTGASLDDNL